MVVPPSVPNHRFVPGDYTYAAGGLPRGSRSLLLAAGSRIGRRHRVTTAGLTGRGGDVLLLLYPRGSIHGVHRVVGRLVHSEGRVVRARLAAVRPGRSVRSGSPQAKALVQHHLGAEFLLADVLLVQGVQLVHELVRRGTGRRMG